MKKGNFFWRYHKW